VSVGAPSVMDDDSSPPPHPTSRSVSWLELAAGARCDEPTRNALLEHDLFSVGGFGIGPWPAERGVTTRSNYSENAILNCC
jgi:hypothetical protein